MNLIQKIANQSYKAFCVNNGTVLKNDQLRHLIDLMKKLTAKDLNVDPTLLHDEKPYGITSKRAPVTYIDVWEDRNFSMGIFVLRPGTRLPLHDHPHMHGVIKVLHGNCLINSFSVEKDNKNKLQEDVPLLKVIEQSEAILDLGSDPVLLTPNSGNCHEILTLNGGVAFFDILSPPYDEEGHQCNYYKLHKLNEAIQYLKQIPPPLDYWTERAKYLGPQIDEKLFHEHI